MVCIQTLSCSSGGGLSANNFVFNETPVGDINCDNIEFQTQNNYISGTLEIYIDGRKLDLTDYIEHGDNSTFTLVVDTNNPNALNGPPRSTENLTVNYIKTTASSGGSCIQTL